jgi:hypothetical protein
MSRQLYYWNTADDVNHTHQRIEWSIKHGYLVCIHINITKKILNSIKENDYILSYEPKYHKKSSFINGDDGKCMTCKYNSKNGLQAFTNLFQINGNVITLSSLDDEKHLGFSIFRNWLSNEKHCKDNQEWKKYFCNYYQYSKKIYIIPVKYIKKLDVPITTNKKKDSNLKYFGSVRKGFDKIYDLTLLSKIN